MLHEDTLSVENGLAVCKAFFFHLWPLLESKLISQKFSQEIYEDTKIFCQSICQGKGSSAEWNEAIFHATGISKENQRELKLTKDDLFLCTIEFCKIYNKRYESNLCSLIGLLEFMKQDSKNYREEEQLFKKSFFEIRTQPYLSYFDWSAEFSEESKLSIEQAFTVCITFFIRIWELIESKLPRPEPNNEYDIHDLFCRVVCLGAATGQPEVHKEWTEIIFKLKTTLKGIQMFQNEIISSMIELSQIYNKRYNKYGNKSNLHYLINLLESMKQNPKNSPQEWLLFKQVIADVESRRLKIDFNWTGNF